MKVVFMGTPDFAVPVLKALCAHHDVIAVYTQPPRPAGKGYKLTPSPVHEEALKRNIPVFTPASFKEEGQKETFAALNADVAVVCAYGLILPKAVLTAPKLGCINTHASLLPRWRGAAPIQRAIMAGDSESGVTIMQMDTGLDTGTMLMKGSCKIDENTTGQLLHDTLSEMGASLIISTLEQMPEPVAQPQEGITYAEKIQKSESALNWSEPADKLCRKIMAFNPYPATYTFANGERIKILTAFARPLTTTKAPGTILDSELHIACGGGTVLQIGALQRSGKKVQPTAEFMKSGFLKSGDTFAIQTDN